MKASRSPSVPVLVAALVCSTGALLLLAAGVSPLAVVAGVCAAVFLAIEFARMSVSTNEADRRFFARLVEQAEAGRRLAIYDRDTGLFAHWYVALRGQEECARAARYGRKLSLLVIEPHADGAQAAWNVQSEIGRWFQTELRSTDVAGYLGNGRYVVLAPETDLRATATLVERLRAKIEHVDIGSSAYPEDGVAFQQLWRRAASRLPEYRARAA